MIDDEPKKKNVRMYDLLCLGGFNQNQSFIVHVHSHLQKKKKKQLVFQLFQKLGSHTWKN